MRLYVCVDCYNSSRINEVLVRVSMASSHVFFKIMPTYRSTWHAIAAFNFKRVHRITCPRSVATLLWVAAKVRRELQDSADIDRGFLASIVTIMVNHYPLFEFPCSKSIKLSY